MGVRCIARVALCIAAVGLFAAVVILVQQARNVSIFDEARNLLYRSPFFGLQKSAQPPVGVMIENHSDSRQFQYGLSSANIVYEAPAEGGITRFLAIFADGSYSDKVGPIRSARMYYIDWMEEYSGLYAHVGGHFDAQARLAQGKKIFNADQFFYEKYFWRENVGKTALEHTMFTTIEKLSRLATEHDIVPETAFHPLMDRTRNIDDVKSEATQEATTIRINFGYLSYNAYYTYSSDTKKYTRMHFDKPHIDYQNGQPIMPSSIVIQRVTAVSNGDAQGTISIQTIGRGQATIFSQGRVIEGTWAKKSITEPTRFFSADGSEIKFPAGLLWVTVLPQYNSFTYQ